MTVVRRLARLLGVAAIAAGGLAGCRTAPPPRPAVPPPGPALEVGRLREELQITPLELVWSGVRGQAEGEESVSIKNVAEAPVLLTGIEITGPQAATFSLAGAPSMPLSLAPGLSLSLAIVFRPPAQAAAGVHRAMLHVYKGTTREESPPVDLAALVLRGRQGDDEPPLQQVVEALGFATDVGGAALKLGTGAEPIGDEVAAPRFRRAKASPVALYPVARFSPDEPIPYGYYTGEAPALKPLGVIAAGQEQTLNPDRDPGAETAFDPGDEPFGLWVKSGKQTIFTEDARNTGPTRHAARVYPLKSRGGARVPDAYLIAFEEAANGDYQDYVFVIWNVAPAP